MTFLRSHDDTEPYCWGSDGLKVEDRTLVFERYLSSLWPLYVLCQILCHVNNIHTSRNIGMLLCFMLLLKQQFLPGASVKQQRANVSYHRFKHSWINQKGLSSPCRMCLGVVHPVTEPLLQRQVEPQQTHESNRLRKLTSSQMRVFAGCWYYPHCTTSFCCFVLFFSTSERKHVKATRGNRFLGKHGEFSVRCEGQTRPIQFIFPDENWQSDEWTPP